MQQTIANPVEEHSESAGHDRVGVLYDFARIVDFDS